MLEFKIDPILNTIDGVMLLAMLDSSDWTETEKYWMPLTPCGILATMHESAAQRHDTQTEKPDLEDGEYEKIPNLAPKSDTTCAPVVDKTKVIFVGSREGKLLEGKNCEDEQDELCKSIVDLSDGYCNKTWENFIWMEVSDIQTDDCKAVCDALMDTVESNVEWNLASSLIDVPLVVERLKFDAKINLGQS